MKKKLSTQSMKGSTQAGAVRYVPGYGSKYLLRQDATLFRKTAGGEYVSVAVARDRRCRLYHLGTEHRRSIDVLMGIVWPEGSLEEILEQDRGVPPGGGVDALEPLVSDPDADLMQDIFGDFEPEAGDAAGNEDEDVGCADDGGPDDMYEL